MADSTDIFIARTITEMRKWRTNAIGKIGFIPTMGYLHIGHLSLMSRAKQENDLVVVSIFVNPKQFGPHEDFNKYPRDVNRDLEILRKAHVDVAFLPEVDEMYPDGFETNISVTNLSRKLEGKIRPGHFDGVATIVSKLFNIIQPQHSYFGQKDAQQVAIIKKMVSDLQFPIDIVIGDTIREKNGLALSSRNVFLDNKQFTDSGILFQALSLAQELFQQGERNPKKIKKAMLQLIKKTNSTIDYVSIANPKTLEELTIIDKEALVSLAVYYGKIRLIDNCILIS